ncbi:MAG: cation:proton antiporter [Geminicoccaceae bacterium]|nr:cation:proton antiporter [Geminicoccaceae bacterium]
MPEAGWLFDALTIVAAGVAVAALTQRLGLGTILGYLLAGALIGPPLLGLVRESEAAAVLGELGVVFLLFTIGLELPLPRLRAVGSRAFVLGVGQMALTIAAFWGLCAFWGIGHAIGIAVGAGLAFSSTAIVLRILTDQSSLFGRKGRTIFAILVVQDVLVGPLLVVVITLGQDGGQGGGDIGLQMALALLKSVLAVGVILFLGRLLLDRLMRAVAETAMPELFTGVTLLIVLGFAGATHAAGLSLAFGAFLAGIILAETGYRHQIAADMRPFRGLLLGLFFVTVGMKVDLRLLWLRPIDVLGLTLVVLTVKALLILLLCYAFGLKGRLPLRVALLLAQGGEFAFVLWGTAHAGGIIPKLTLELLILVVAITMGLTPLLALVERRLAREAPATPPPDVPGVVDAELEAVEGHVVVAGCGLVGRQVLRHLRDAGRPAVGIDLDARQVARARARGLLAWYGDASQPDVLETVHVERARAVVVAFDDSRTVVRLVTLLRYLFPDMPILARVHVEADADELTRAGATLVVPEVIDTGRHLAEPILGKG